MVLGRSCGLCWRSWAALGANVGGLGLLLGSMLAVLGRSWGLCWRSWVALGAYVGGLGPLQGPKLAVLAALGASEGGLGTGSWRKAAQTRKSAPNPSGSRVPKGSGPPNPPNPPSAPFRLPIFSIDNIARRHGGALDTALSGPLLRLLCHHAHMLANLTVSRKYR